MKKLSSQQGFTAIELLITLFVAAAFLIASYQLFSVVVKDGGQARAESRAGNVAYDYMRRYAPFATSPCSPQTILNNSAVTIDGLSNVKITLSISCPAYSTTAISKVEVAITFNSPQQTVKYATLTTGTGSQVADVTEGLIDWWKFNGDATSSVGTANGTVTNATLTTGQNNQANGAYNFNGTNAKINFPLTNLPAVINTISISLWTKTASVQSPAAFITAPIDSNNIISFFPASLSGTLVYWYFGNNNAAGSITVAHNAAWLNVWNHWVLTSSPLGGMKIYRNGALLTSGAQNQTVTRGVQNLDVGYYAGGASYWSGQIDDMRIYNRELTSTEASTIYSAGAQ